MLIGLAIRDIVLIERLDLVLGPGLCVLTGETGAGKSILLDALGLALGYRADAGLVRHGAAQGSVTASFDLPAAHPAYALLAEQGLAAEEGLVLRRVLQADGKSRAFVNDQPIGVGLLRRLGDLVVEIHGQNDEQGLLDAATHRAMLDLFGGLDGDLAAVGQTYETMHAASAAAAAAEAESSKARADEDYLRHVSAELAALDPQPDEDAILAADRLRLQNGEKLAGAVQDAEAALDEQGGVASRLRLALRALERMADKAGGHFDAAIATLERALNETDEAAAAIVAAGRALDLDPRRLEQVEERLFALRAAARKHNVPVDQLVPLREEFDRRLAAIDDGGARLAALQAGAKAARISYVSAAEKLRAARQKTATRLDKAVARELAPLKLGAAKFGTLLQPLEESGWSSAGMDRVQFQIATNAGAPAGPLSKIASGGELSRFMLALKVVLAGQGSAATLVFDEVDRGVGGATADAVGERLAKLASDMQVLVVTHSPQVAARGAMHWRIAKEDRKAGRATSTVTTVVPLDAGARQEEIARMLAGATVTAAARAAAASLLAPQGA